MEDEFQSNFIEALGTIEKQIRVLTKTVDEFAERLQQIEIKSFEFKVKRFEGKPLVRNHKFYPQVLDKIEAIKKLYPEYTLQDILNTILDEALDKYLR